MLIEPAKKNLLTIKKMEQKPTFDSQFTLPYSYYFNKINLSDWFRYYAILKAALLVPHSSVLEIGAGNHVIKDFLGKSAQEYKTMDVNPNLQPDFLCSVRDFQQLLEKKFDVVICSEVLEHMPFSDFENNIINLRRYLVPDGHAFITLPHHRGRVMVVTPFSYHIPNIFNLPRWLKGGLRSFYKQIIQGKTWIDPHHCWEIDDQNIKPADIARLMKKTGFKIESFSQLLQADFWVLSS